MSYWAGKNVLVTGGSGFIGSHLVDKLIAEGSKVRVCDNLERGTLHNIAHQKDEIQFVKADLRDFDTCLKLADGMDIVMHLAARLGGIIYMSPQMGMQSEVYTSNVQMNTNMIEAARQKGVKKFLFTSTACIYPIEKQMDPNSPALKEEDAYPALPESTYGWAKLMGEIQAQWYAKEYGMKIAVIRMFNVYGEREDLELNKAHVVPALVHKAVKYPKMNPYIVFGTGKQTRSFLYVSDSVTGILVATEKTENADPINIGTDERVTIKELAERVIKISGKKIQPVYDPTKPTGMFARSADWTKARKLLGWKHHVSLDEGLTKTYKWAEQVLNSQRN